MSLPNVRLKPFGLSYGRPRFLNGLGKLGIFSTGVGGSSVDFRVPGPTEWLIEIVSIRASDGVRRATHQTGIVFTFQLSTDNPDLKQRPEAELIRAEEKIGEKVWANGSPTKFSIPVGAMHLILVDMRGYLDGGGHKNDYRQITYGGRDPEATRKWIGYSWEISPGKREPIKGLFEEDNLLPAARPIQERIHFLGFVSEREYREGEMRDIKIAHYLANPHFFPTHADAEKAFVSYPLRPEIP